MIIYYLIRWLVCWVKIIDGVLGVMTLGFFRPNLSFKLIRIQARYKVRNLK